MQKIRWSMVVGLGAVVLYVTHVVQPISDLTATGAPNRNLLLFSVGTLMLWMVLVALGFGRLPRQNLTEVPRG